jgi:hypothetical protein
MPDLNMTNDYARLKHDNFWGIVDYSISEQDQLWKIIIISTSKEIIFKSN